jgi:hypothetical protein
MVGECSYNLEHQHRIIDRQVGARRLRLSGDSQRTR